jgi:hypothetical protein
MAGDIGTLELQVGVDRDADAEELDDETRRLRRRLLELDVESVEPASQGPPPPGTRAVDAAAIGTLLVSLATTAPALASLVTTLRGWVGGKSGRSIKLVVGGDTLEISDASREEQDRLIEAWIARHAGNR